MRPPVDATTKTTLDQLQRWMRWVVTNPKGPYKALTVEAALEAAPLPTDFESATRFQEPLPRQLGLIEEAPPIDRTQRLSVYADAYFIRLVESLGADFRAVRRALTAEEFQRLAADYLLRHPSSSPHIGDVGQSLPEFIRQHALSQTHRFLPDLARLEWNVLRSIYTDRLPALDTAALADVSAELWPRASLTLDPTVRLLGTEWAVDQLWEKRQEDPESGGAHLSRRRRRWLVVYRDEVWVRVHPIDGAQWFALERIREGASLEKVCSDLAGLFEDAESLPIMNWFAEWIQRGIVKRIQFKEIPA